MAEPQNKASLPQIDWEKISGELMKNFEWAADRVHAAGIDGPARRDYARVSAEIARTLVQVSAEARAAQEATRGDRLKF